jgi:hypothetical protein
LILGRLFAKGGTFPLFDPVSGEKVMLLHVSDMGLVPDGRFLEHASIEAESSVLTDADGNLRATDVGKNIAVPGAVDLSARIIELVDQKDVADASMEAGSDTLAAVIKLLIRARRLNATLLGSEGVPIAALATVVGIPITLHDSLMALLDLRSASSSR